MEKLSKNLIWMAAANITSGVLNAALFIYLARVLLPEGFGYLSSAFAITFFLSNFIDLGLSTYGAREIARDKARVSEYASEIVSLRILMAIGLTVLFTAVTLVLGLSKDLKILMLGSSLVFLRAAFSSEWVFQGEEKMGSAFGLLASTAALQVGMVLAFVKGQDDLFMVPVFYFAPAVPIALFFLKRVNFRLALKPARAKKVLAHLSGSAAIWGISMFAQVYNGFDIFILGLFRRMDEVGCFTIARRAIGGAVLLMIFLANAVLPNLAASFGRDMPQFALAIRRFLKLAVLSAALGILPIAIFSKAIISMTVGSEYLPAAPAFNIMAMGLIAVCLNIPYSTGLIAGGLERDVLKQTAASAAISVILNFLLMPKYGMIGAAVSFVIVEAVAFAWVSRVYKSKIAFNERRGR